MLLPPAIIIIHICKIQRNCSIHSCMYKTQEIRKLMKKVYNLLGLFVRSLDIETCLVETLRDAFSCRKLMCCGVWGLVCWLSIFTMHNNAWSLSSTFSLGENKQARPLSFSFSLEREPSKLLSKIRWLSSSQKHKGCLAGWLVVSKGASSAYAHIGIYHHRCAHLLDCCMDFLLLLLHCFSCIASISRCNQNTKLFFS